MMGLGILSIFIIPVLAIVVLAIFLDKKSKVGYGKKLIISMLFLLPFTYDIVITNILGLYYCKIAPPHPKTKIVKKVEYPQSIYWEDNVYPGFSKQDRELMIINYLDGVHLKTMALNGNDGKVYLYHLDKPILEKLKQKYSSKEWYSKGIKEYVSIIMKGEKIYTKSTMPKLNYTVTFNEVKLPGFVRKFLYSDETKVIENTINKVIAYNRRYMRFFYNIFPDFELGNRYYYHDVVCGDWQFGFERNIFTCRPDNNFKNSDKHKIDLNEFLYKKYIKEEK
jgi:hypothetical protein